MRALTLKAAIRASSAFAAFAILASATCGMRSVNQATGVVTAPFIPPSGPIVSALYLLFSNGQSLSTGDLGDPFIDSGAVANVLQILDTAATYSGTAETTYFLDAATAPLRANVWANNTGNTNPYPNNIGGETHDIWAGRTVSWFASTTTSTDASTIGFGLSNVGQGGSPYSVVGPDSGTGNAFKSNLNEATIYTKLIDAGHQYPSVIALAQTIVHGEADEALAGGDASYPYAADLTEWQAAYNTDYPILTGQDAASLPNGQIPLVISQQNSTPFPSLGTGWPVITVQQWSWCLANPTKCVMSGPKYGVDYNSSGWVHLTALGYQEVGEKEGEAIWWWWRLGGWSPLWVISTVIVGNVATLTLHVPVGPLQTDLANLPPHPPGSAYGDSGSVFGAGNKGWSGGKGAECWGAGGVGGTAIGLVSTVFTSNPAGTNVTATVTVTCSSAPTVVAYALTPDIISTGTGGFTAGRNTFARCGTIMDSDPFVGPFSGVAQPNRLVAFHN